MAADVRVQVVLYETPEEVCIRLLRALEACARLAIERSAATTVSVAVGDCTPMPCVGPAARQAVVGRAAVPVSWHAFEENLGHGAGQNRLASMSPTTTSVLVFVNPDAYPAPEALHELLVTLADERVGLAEGRQLPIEIPKAVDASTGDTPWCAGCLLAIDRPLFERLGGFDEAFFLHGDDVDLSWRVRAQGLRTVYVPAAAVFHDRGVDPTGYATSNDTEARYIHLGELLRAWKAERTDLVDRLLDRVDRDGLAPEQVANADFRALRDSGDLPDPYGFDASPFLADASQRRF